MAEAGGGAGGQSGAGADAEGERERQGEALLAHRRIPGGAREAAAYFLHGIFGAGRNWTTVARRTVGARPEWEAVLVDLRMHGASRGFPPPHTVEACAADVLRLAGGLERPADAVVGHSFGGKVALALARSLVRDPAGGQGGDPGSAAPGRRLHQVWVVDASPSARRVEGSVGKMLGALRALPERFGERQEAVRALKARGFSTPVARFMASSLEKDDGGFRWSFDPDALEALFESYMRTDLWDVVSSPPEGVEIRFLKASRSEVLPPEECRRLESLEAGGVPVRLHRVEGGHWLNADAPEAVVDLLKEGLSARQGTY